MGYISPCLGISYLPMDHGSSTELTRLVNCVVSNEEALVKETVYQDTPASIHDRGKPCPA